MREAHAVRSRYGGEAEPGQERHRQDQRAAGHRDHQLAGTKAPRVRPDRRGVDAGRQGERQSSFENDEQIRDRAMASTNGTTVENLNILDTSKTNNVSGLEIITLQEVANALFPTTNAQQTLT
ncbi:hypothetical protein, partial [Luteitalea sp.]